MKQKLISVIVPIYGVEKYLKKAIESIQNQTYKNLEIILVDDESKDNCGAICEEYAKKDSRIKVIHKKNGGQASARNAGLKIATGEYINFFDPDDYLEPTFFEYLMKLANKYNADITECSFRKFYENTGKEEYTFPQDEIEEIVTDNMGALNRLFSENWNIYLNAIITWNKIYKKEILDKVKFSEVRIYEEFGTVYKMLYECKRFVTSNKSLYTYLQRDGSTLTRKFSDERLAMLDGYQQSADFFASQNLIDLELKAIKKYFATCMRFKGMIAELEEKEKLRLEKEINKRFNKMKKRLNQTLIREKKAYQEIANQFYNKEEEKEEAVCV